VIFPKYNNTIIGPGDDIVLPKNSRKPDYEAELGFVIGKGGRHIEPEKWRDHVFGYLNCNDVSARDFQTAVSQWTMGKNFDTFAPMGPWIVTADEIADPHNLAISLTLNGERMQNSNTRELIFKIPETIAFLSSVMTLEPGDIVLTGTPAGVGFGHRPPRWLTPGAEVIVSIEGLGQLRNTCVSEA
jgi:2-keto-4-pentenoate hydratase/2-oxohepta-3-ene-1,7-dioic acid hydratase in catechol pathway